MPYADSDFYTTKYRGSAIPAADLDSYLQGASDIVDQLTFFGIPQRGGIDKLTQFQQNQIKLAVCNQADFNYARKDMPEGVESYSLSGTSVKLGVSQVSRIALNYLLPTNLLYRGL